ncbi:MAG: helix-turn-helix domain-containing protein [Agathobacter sp.]|nr:helix-turn-helix domain-containing protein [Agathobacter sp.]
MVEFGEKLKKAREEKGMTQQTLADHLYVTRQAVSRWECGARYPDLLTAKKLSDMLEVSLDELLSGEEIKKCVEKNQIVESPVIGRVQSALYAFVGVAYLLMSIWALRFLLPELASANLQTVEYGISYILRYVLITILLFVGLTFSVYEKLTPKKTGVIVAAYFGMELFSNIFEPTKAGNIWMNIFQSLIYLISIVVIVGYYFQKRRRSPIPMYCVVSFGLIRNIFMYFQMIQLTSDFTFIVRSIWLVAVAGYMVLIAYQTYALEKKWRLAVK